MNIHDYIKIVENRSKSTNRFRDLVLQAKHASLSVSHGYE